VNTEETDAKSVVIQLRVLQQIDNFRCGYHALINAALLVEVLSLLRDGGSASISAAICKEYLEDKIVSSEFFWAHHSQMLDMLSLTFDPK